MRGLHAKYWVGMMGSVTSTTDDGMLEIGGEDGNVGQGRGASSVY